MPLSNEFGGIFKTICARIIMLKHTEKWKKKEEKNEQKPHQTTQQNIHITIKSNQNNRE